MMSELSLYCLKYAESILPESMVFDGGIKEKYIPISFAFYFIETQDRKILIDVGCDTMPGFVMKKQYSPAFVLRTVGVLACEITDVIITHAHHDHIEAVKHFTNACIHISKAEYKNAKPYLYDGMNVNVFEEELVVTEQIKIIEIGGHSVGSSIVEIKTKNG